MQVRGLGECGEQRAQQLAIVRYARGPYQPRSAAPTYEVGLPQGIVSTARAGLAGLAWHFMFLFHISISPDSSGAAAPFHESR